MSDFFEFALLNWYLFVALLVILGLLAGEEVLRRMRGIGSVNPTQALQIINHDEALILDIRDNGAYKSGHIPQARNIPLANLAGRLNELNKFKSKPVILYAQPGLSASNAGALLKKNGFATVHHLSGDLPAWINANLPISKK